MSKQDEYNDFPKPTWRWYLYHGEKVARINSACREKQGRRVAQASIMS